MFLELYNALVSGHNTRKSATTMATVAIVMATLAIVMATVAA